MTVNTSVLIPMTDANQNFSKVVHLVEEQGMAVILKNNRPKYVVVGFQEYDEITAIRKKLIERTADSVIHENMEALRELAK